MRHHIEYDYGSGIVATMALGGSCAGAVDDDGVLSCSGAFANTTEVQGMTFDNSGTFTTTGTVDGDLLEAMIVFTGTLGSGSIPVTAVRQP